LRIIKSETCMFELRIVGATPHELMSNLNSAAMALIGEAPRTPVEPKPDIFPEGDQVGAETVAQPGPNPSVSEQPKRGRKPKTTVVIDVEPNPTPAEPLQAADFLDETPAAVKGKATVEDCRDAVRQVLDNFEKRARDADPSLATLKGAAKEAAEVKLMNAKVAWAKPLLAEFGAAKVADLKPEQFDAFVAAAQPYIDGTKA
jgi:hypothetical protein